MIRREKKKTNLGKEWFCEECHNTGFLTGFWFYYDESKISLFICDECLNKAKAEGK
jgi:hypothetical protein